MKHINMDLLLDSLKNRILILDGAMGTMLQQQGLTETDFRGTLFADSKKALKGNNDRALHDLSGCREKGS